MIDSNKFIDTSYLTDEVVRDMIVNPKGIVSYITELMQRKEEELLVKVLTNYLGREPKQEDFKRVTRYFYPNNPDGYELAYDNVLLGEVKTERPTPFDFEYRFAINFIPASSE